MFLNLLFILSSLLVIFSCIFVLVTKNIMHSCVYLLGALLGVAGLYITLGADFVAASQVMVYVGGVVILMLFAVMLTGGKNIYEFARNGLSRDGLMGSKKTYILGALSALVLLATIARIFSVMMKQYDGVGIKSFQSTVEEIGTLFLTDHLLAFEISSVLLLGAIIGAAIIARPNKN